MLGHFIIFVNKREIKGDVWVNGIIASALMCDGFRHFTATAAGVPDATV